MSASKKLHGPGHDCASCSVTRERNRTSNNMRRTHDRYEAALDGRQTRQLSLLVVKGRK
jgi:hypothetical protein